MSTNLRNIAPFLRVQRRFPYDNTQALSVEVDRSYVDVASCVNSRTIGIFSTDVQIVNGESWFLQGGERRLQGLRQVYTFTTTAPIPHGLNLVSIDRFTNCFGSFTNGTNWYGILFGSNVAIAGQISFYIDPVNINILSGIGAPTLVQGTIVLEWLSQV